MASKELLDMLNKAVARELQVSIQYMWQQVLWKGVKAFSVKDNLRKIAITEMRHAEEIAARLSYLGDKPTTKPEPIFVGETLNEMVEQDKKDEEGAIELYKQIINKAFEEGDTTTAEIFRKILQDEEEHHAFFSSLLEK